MNPISKKVLVSSMAAAIVLGGAGYLQNKTIAAASTDTAAAAAQDGQTGTDTTASDAAKNREGKWMGHKAGGPRGGSIVKETAEILGLTEADIRTALEAGSTFAEIAEGKGMAQSAFVQKLIELETVKIEELLSEGGITETQAAEWNEGLSDRLTQIVESSDAGLGKGHGKGGRGFGKFGNPEEIAALLGVSEDELKAGMEEGQSLAEIAAAKGMTEDQLIQKLKDQMTEPLKQWVNEKHTDADKSTAAAGETDEDTE
ncbi:hypothetical protein MHI43_03915 [Paenibacillus sp. FSL H8-0457]|uniref:hypothetical protein n=1 Tax=unclassified Paenibacillus TaxID=185978 RepID=UPI00017889A5|nr:MULTISPECIES: hypothetical protein [unclassified Paenibacillus]ACX63072.1 conserved hypothetical protein [Paenibacillus sp. Y412MC10]ETT60478.1 hypothetical protein C172_22383 [Paenibacillus sp. FSL H8-457]